MIVDGRVGRESERTLRPGLLVESYLQREALNTTEIMLHWGD